MITQLDILFQDDIFLVGKRIPLTASMKENQQIITSFWQRFNRTLKSIHMPMADPWIKYGITLQEQDRFYYLCALPSMGCYPEDFELFQIPRGHWLHATHTGAMSTISQSITQLQKSEAARGQVIIKQGSLRYYEVYQDGFQFEAEHSRIEIFLPIEKEKDTTFPLLPAKTILAGSGAPRDRSAYRNSWFGMDFNMNLYKGCCHGCVYCDSRSSCYRVEHFDIVKGKENALILLENELKKKRRKGTIGIGAMSDTYNPFEKQQQITRQALMLIERYGYGVGIDTKSTLILRDLELLQRIAAQYPSIFKVTITCADDVLSKKLEPFAPSSSQRFDCVKQLHAAGLFTGILLMPILPFINDTEENILGIVRKAHEAGARFIFTYGGFGLTLRDNQRDYFYHWLDQAYPGMRFTYENQYHKMYSCMSPHSKKLTRLFEDACKSYGILYRMSDIIRAYKPEIPNQQLQFKL